MTEHRVFVMGIACMRAQLVLENVTCRLPSRVLFEGVNWTLYEGTRLTLAGRNGSGKSTLLRILAGEAESTEGQCTTVGGGKLNIGFLDQALLERAATSLSDNQNKLSAPQYLYQIHIAKRSEEDGLELEWEIGKILSGLGFSEQHHKSSMRHLSGGWLLRVFIASALLSHPDVLLLDEPTNHLDISSIQWLEEFLMKDFPGSLILVSHDVALQRKVTNSLAVIHGGRFFHRSHQNDYLSFVASLGEEKVLIQKNMESLQKRIDSNMEFVHKFRAKAQTANRAQSKLRMAQSQEAELRQLKDQLQRIEGNQYNLTFHFRLGGTGGKFPFSVKNLGFKYSGNAPHTLSNVNFDIKRGQRVAIIGENGAGKTTLLNLLAGRLTPTEGEIQQGYATEIGYFGQHQLDELDLAQTVLDNLKARAVGMGLQEVRGWLGAFGFGSEDEVNKPAKVLSGGEKARLALLRIIVTRVNCLLLDEPTNHLDIETKELLKNSIRQFEGTTLFVSHDRDFVQSLAERILFITNDHRLIDHFGDLESFYQKYPEFVRHLEGRKLNGTTTTEKPKAITPAIPYEERKKLKNQLKSHQRKVEQIEKDLAAFDVEKQKVDPNNSYDQLGKIDSEIMARMLEWERLATEIEKLKTLLGHDQ